MAHKKRKAGLSPSKLEAMIETATVDAYDHDEQLTRWACVLEDNLELPFETMVLGVTVQVVAVEHRGEGLVAVCQRGCERQRVALSDLPLPNPRPKGSEWIDAYRAWLEGEW